MRHKGEPSSNGLTCESFTSWGGDGQYIQEELRHLIYPSNMHGSLCSVKSLGYYPQLSQSVITVTLQERELL